MSRKTWLAVLLSLAPLVACAETPFDGFYGGVSVGATNFDTQTADYWCIAACDAPGTSRTGPTVAGNLGYNWSFGSSFVVGIEADLSSGLEASETDVGSYEGEYSSYSWTTHWKDEVRALGSIRGRAGLAVDRTLLYVTAGLAGARVRHQARYDYDYDYDYYDVNVRATDRSTEAALIAGAGIEHLFTDRLSLKAEYLATRLRGSQSCWIGTSGYNGTSSDCHYNSAADMHWRSTIDTFRIGLNWKF